MKRLSARLAVTLLTVLRVAALRADDCCDRCGCAVCRRVARVVREMKKVAVNVYTYESVDAAEQPCGEKCTCHDSHDPCGPDAAIPLDSDHLLGHRLVERTHFKEIPTYKWVVEYLCEDCTSETETASVDGPSPRSRQQWDSLGLIADWSAARGCSAEKTHYLVHN